jgi:hypothetical protein
MKWYVAGPTLLFLAGALIAMRRARTGPAAERPRRLVGAVALLAAAVILAVFDLTI